MDALTSAAASGLRSRMESLDLLANNIANSNTAGFKADREFYNLYVAPEALEEGGAQPVQLPVVESRWTDFSQGTLSNTGNPLDLGLSGKGFFAINGSNGPLYTRSGNFRIGKGGQIETQDGMSVRKQGGGTLTVDPRKSLSVAPDGSVAQDGQVIGKLDVVDVEAPNSMSKMGTNYF